MKIIKPLVDPSNRGEQIDGVVEFVLDNPAHYEALRNRPARLNAAAMNLFMRQDCNSYHARVVRTALRELQTTSQIDTDAPIYTNDQLFDW